MTCWWAVSPVDSCVHLLVREGEHLTGVVQARCGVLLPTDVPQLDQPPPGPPCEPCRQIFIADFTTTRSRPAAG